ncbi:MAG: X-Pro dipeptidyl-peptidase domain protein [Actinomycetia bacterium]|nr:X-Pro dipeptidyl-peptidase domain protein [Actinomycetes bacterium]
MLLLSRIVERILELPPALTRDVRVTRDLRAPLDDGVELLADLYQPRHVPNAPTVLIRSPYGRRGWVGFLTARPLAERGYQVLVQSCRGTGGSGGDLDPFGQERADGLATLDWVERQAWFHGDLLTFGPSYLGYVQWAMAPEAGDRITAMSAMVTASQFRDQTYMGDTYTLRGTLSWSALMVGQEQNRLLAQVRDAVGNRRVLAAMDHLPLGEADLMATGRRVEWFQQWLGCSEPDHPYWVSERDHRARVPEVTAPVTMIAGWYDLFLDDQLADYTALRAAGRNPYLTVGPWSHTDPKAFGAAIRDALEWFPAQVSGDTSGLREQPVRLFVQGAQEWRDYPEWPPPGTVETAWYLHPGGALTAGEPAESNPDRFRYDPSDPTPGIGGPLLGPGAGRKDNAALEARPDVLVYTGDALSEPLEIIGPVSARVHLRSSLDHTDVFVRLCDVDARGRSWNVCDGIQRVTPERFPAGSDGVRQVEVRLWPTAYRFRPGHRLRIQVSSGSHPRFARNPGTGEPLATAIRLVAAEQEILHDPEHPSAIILPVA